MRVTVFGGDGRSGGFLISFSYLNFNRVYADSRTCDVSSKVPIYSYKQDF
jgi:hypothetical protein